MQAELIGQKREVAMKQEAEAQEEAAGSAGHLRDLLPPQISLQYRARGWPLFSSVLPIRIKIIRIRIRRPDFANSDPDPDPI